MTEERSDLPVRRDGVVIPAILVMAGGVAPPLPPGWIRLPARIVMRKGSPLQAGPLPGLAAAPAMAESGGGVVAAGGVGTRPKLSAMRGVGQWPGDPIGTFLRVNDRLDRAPAKPPAATDAPALDPNTPVPFIDDDGKPVLDPDGKPMMRPAGFPDAHFFVQLGLRDKAALETVMQAGDPATAAGWLANVGRHLVNLRQGGIWDAQRVGGKNHEIFRAYATVAIGLYAAAAGIPEKKTLLIEDSYAFLKSNFINQTMDRTYTNLPVYNVENTKKGYDLYERFSEGSR